MTTTLEGIEVEELDACPDCNGSGEIGTGEREYETGMWITRDCRACDGGGCVDAQLVSTCDGCGTRFWTGEGCNHHGVHCDVCKPARCLDCTDEQAHTTAELNARALIENDVWSTR